MLLRNIGSVLTAVLLLGIVLAADGNSDKEPSWKTEFRKAYGLKEGELIRRVAPPYPECRTEFFRDRVRQVYLRIKQALPAAEATRDYSDHFTKFAWNDGWPVDELMMSQVPVKPEDGAQLGQLLRMATGFSATRTDGWAVVLGRKVTGDFVVQVGAPPEKLIVALEKILRRECKMAITLKVQDVERDVYVFSGKYKSQPLADRKDNEIEIYSLEFGDRRTGGGGSGSLEELAGHIEGFIEAPVVIEEVTAAPKVVEWHFNYRSPFTDAQRSQDHDPEAVTDNIAAQTGLQVKLEQRKIKVLLVGEEEEKK